VQKSQSRFAPEFAGLYAGPLGTAALSGAPAVAAAAGGVAGSPAAHAGAEHIHTKAITALTVPCVEKPAIFNEKSPKYPRLNHRNAALSLFHRLI
jgi:hypothetical protein